MPRWQRSSWRLHLALLLATTATCSSRSAGAAEPLPLRLEWTAPDECPSGEQVTRELSRITRVRPGRSLVPLEARGVVVQQLGGYRLTLDLLQGDRSKQAHFDSKTCPPLQKAATLVLVLAFGDGALLTNGPDESSAAVVKQPVAPTVTPPRHGPRATSRVRAVPWLGAVASSGFIGAAVVGADLGVGFGARHWAAFGRANLLPPVESARQSGVSAELAALLGSAGFCGRGSWERLRVDACLALEAGAVRASSLGAARDGSVTAPWLAVSPLLSALLPLVRPFALRAELAAAMPLSAPRYDVAPYGTLFATARFVPRGGLGVAVEL